MAAWAGRGDEHELMDAMTGRPARYRIRRHARAFAAALPQVIPPVRRLPPRPGVLGGPIGQHRICGVPRIGILSIQCMVRNERLLTWMHGPSWGFHPREY